MDAVLQQDGLHQMAFEIPKEAPELVPGADLLQDGEVAEGQQGDLPTQGKDISNERGSQGSEHLQKRTADTRGECAEPQPVAKRARVEGICNWCL